ncbi:MAG: acyltransferase family protein [Deltaproteobacteria bacterium]|nr:acyltransferase family protein [Deltaproteobacteria bacterium]
MWTSSDLPPIPFLPLSKELEARIDSIPTRLSEFGYDEFGYSPAVLKKMAPLAEWFYRNYFRVETFGIEQLPEGPYLLIGNHSGQFPLDGMFVGTALILDANPPRMVRAMVERWAFGMPLIGEFFSRVGQIVGTPENCRRLLGQGEVVMVFPEGAVGISKPYKNRYKLTEFGLGFMRLALENRVPIVPFGVVGAEEMYPAFTNAVPLAKLLKTPSFPITPTLPWLGPLGLIPLPTRIRIYFGAAMRFEGDPDDDDGIIGQKVLKVKEAIAAMLARGVKEREAVFW